MYPDATLIVAADDDYQTEGNPGRTAATSAAKAVGGLMVVPVFPADCPDEATDFNDLHQLVSGGAEVVRACFDQAIESISMNESDAWADGQLASEPLLPAPISENTANDSCEAPPVSVSPFPGTDERPLYVVLDDWTKSTEGKHRPGVYFCGVKLGKKGEIEGTFDLWFCSPLHVDGVTYDGHGNNFGRLWNYSLAMEFNFAANCWQWAWRLSQIRRETIYPCLSNMNNRSGAFIVRYKWAGAVIHSCCQIR